GPGGPRPAPTCAWGGGGPRHRGGGSFTGATRCDRVVRRASVRRLSGRIPPVYAHRPPGPQWSRPTRSGRNRPSRSTGSPPLVPPQALWQGVEAFGLSFLVDM